MANSKHIEILRKGVSFWNNWRNENETIKPDLSELNLTGFNLVKINFQGANLTEVIFTGENVTGANFAGANLTKANFIKANLAGATLSNAKLFSANLSEACFTDANFHKADLSHAILRGANLANAHLFIANFDDAKLNGAKLNEADIRGAKFRRTDLSEVNLNGAQLLDTIFDSCVLKNTDFTRCFLGYTVFSFVDLKEIIGIETINHTAPSSIGIETLYISEGKLPEVFIRGCGVPDSFINYIPSLVGATQAIQFYSCFISYSNQDDDFAKRLHARMRQANMRVWFAPEDMKGGKKLNEQIESAIHLNDRLLVILSENSLRSKWVLNEIRRARAVEEREHRRKLFPIRLIDFKHIQEWEKLNPNIDIDIAEEIRSYHIPSFINWKDHDTFENEFKKLYSALKAEENKAK